MNHTIPYNVRNQHRTHSFESDPVLYIQSSYNIGGWERDRFTQDMSEYSCTICHHVYKEAMTLQCGHTFCQSCLFMQESIESTCKQCDTLCIQVVPDFSKRMKINQSISTCRYKEQGCTWIDTLQHTLSHEATCTYKQVACEKCHSLCSAHQLEHHRTIECEYRLLTCKSCNHSFTKLTLEHHETNKCPELQTSCEYCSWTGKQGDKKTHLETCSTLYIPCRYALYGCTSKVTRDEMMAHEQEMDHFSMVCSTLEQREKEWKTKWLLLHQDGPFHIRTHTHLVTLCSDGKEDVCSECTRQLQEENGTWFGYYCTQGCPYHVCMDCFSKVRLYKSKTTKWYKK